MFVLHDPAGATTVAPIAASGGHVWVPPEEVARQRIAPYSGLRPAAESQMPNPQFGSAFVPPVAPNNMDKESSAHFTRIHAIIGASLLGSALLLVLSCALFQYCKKARRQRSQYRGSSSTATSRWESTQATGDEAAAAAGRDDADADLELSLSLPLPPQQSPPSLYEDDCAEDDVDDVPNQQTPLRGAGRDKTAVNTSSRSGSENELSRLADSYCRDGAQPVRYCFVGNAGGQIATALVTLNSAVAAADIPATLVASRGRPTEETSPALDTPAKAHPPSQAADLTLTPTTPSVLDNVSLTPTSAASGVLSLPGPPFRERLSTPAAAHLTRPELSLLTPESITIGKAKSVLGGSLASGNKQAGPTPRAQSVKRKCSQLGWKVLHVRSPSPSSHQQGLQTAALWSSRIAGVRENDSSAAVSDSLSTSESVHGSKTSVDTPTACTTFDQRQNEVVSAAKLSIPQLNQESPTSTCPTQLAVVAENDFCSLSPLKIISLVESRADGANKSGGQMATDTDPDKNDCYTSFNDQWTRCHVDIFSTAKDCQDTSFRVAESVRYSQESGHDHCDNSLCVAFCEHDIKDQQVGKSRVTSSRVVSVMSPASDTSSETSQFLATLTLELSPSDVIVDDVATLARSVHLSSDRDSTLSDESLISLQDLRAQAEFSPYHLAWSTPYLSQRFDDEYPAGPSKLPAAKRLIMCEPETASFADSASRRSVPPTTATAEIGTVHQQPSSGQPDIERDESSSWLVLDSEMPAGVATSFSSLLQSWGVWKDPGKTSPGPSKEARATGAGTGTPRPLSFPLQSGSQGATSNDSTLPYTVAEYRRSLMNVSLSGRTEPPDAHWEDVPSASPSPYSSPSSGAYSSNLQGGSTATTQLAYCRVLSGPFASEAGCSDREETCNTVLASRDRACNLTKDNTLADIEDFTDSSSGGHYGEATTGSSDPGYYCLGSHSKGSHDVSNYGVACQSALTSPTHSSPLLSTSASSKSYVTSPSELSRSDLSGESLSPAAVSGMSTRSGGTSTAPLTDHSDLASRNSSLEKSTPMKQSSQRPLSPPANFPATNDNSLPVDNYYPFSTAPAGADLSGSGPLSPASGGSRNSTSSSLMMPRSRSATVGSLSYYGDHDPAAFWPQPSSPAPPCHLRRSRTSGEISPARQHSLRLWEEPAPHGRPLRHNPRLTSLMSVGSASDVSVSSATAASRLSLLWDHECLASGRAFSESLTWEDDPCLEQVTEIILI